MQPSSTAKSNQTKTTQAQSTKKTKLKTPQWQPLTNETGIDFLKKFGAENPETKVIMKTTKGDITLKLYEETPLHRANFVALAKKKIIDDALFYRVINDFIIQGGNRDDDDFLKKRRRFGSYDIPAEFHDKFYHKRGAIAMARDYSNNPEKTSSTYSFYIVQGTAQTKGSLLGLEVVNEIDIPEWKEKAYLQHGGQPALDGEHTVFGEVIKGMDMVNSIAAVATDDGDWPIHNVSFTLEVLKD